MNEDHYYLVKMMPHEKGKERTLAERTISRCFLGYSSFEDVIEVEQRRKTRTSNDRSRIRDLSVENRVVKREVKELHVKIKNLEQESSSLKKENEQWRREMKRKVTSFSLLHLINIPPKPRSLFDRAIGEGDKSKASSRRKRKECRSNHMMYNWNKVYSQYISYSNYTL